MIFQGYEIKKYIYDSIKDLGFADFTDVQKSVFNKLNSSKNILAKSKTGSGKSHAFLIPIFNALDEKLKEVQSVIITPTTELANQLYKVASHMASFCSDEINIKLYCGGSDRNREIEKLKNNQPQIVIGTPGKIKDLVIDENILKIYTSKFLVIDEVDMALEQGFLGDLDGIAAILKDKKMMFFSATISEAILPFVKKYLDSPEFINIEDTSKLLIEHIWIPLKHHERSVMLERLIEVINPYLAMVFVNKKESVNAVAQIIKSKGYEVGTIHGDLTPRERKRVLQNANELKYNYIVATDLAARGIDIDGVSHVINYEIPLDYEFYVHRTGRTGRMNYSGIAYSFYEQLDDRYLDNLNKKGVTPKYFEIKNKELVEYKGRNVRSTRVKPLSEEEIKAKRIIKKPTKVTPGYKKKMAKQANEIATKMKSKKGNKR